MTAHEKPGRKPRRVILDTGPAAAAEGGSTGILVRRFLEYVRHERALSVNTQQAYQRDLRDFSAEEFVEALFATDAGGAA